MYNKLLERSEKKEQFKYRNFTKDKYIIFVVLQLREKLSLF